MRSGPIRFLESLKMQNGKIKIVGNEEGFALVASMMILLIVVVIGIAATNTSNIEHQIAANDRFEKVDFYNQEACLATAKFNFRTWLTNAFLTAGQTVAFFPPGGNDANGNGINDDSECIDPNGIVVGSFKTRAIEITSTAVVTWEDLDGGDPDEHPANNFPPKLHNDKPDPGSGYDQTNFEIRRYAITTYSPDVNTNTILQEGTYKVFNTF